MATCVENSILLLMQFLHVAAPKRAMLGNMLSMTCIGVVYINVNTFDFINHTLGEYFIINTLYRVSETV